MDGRRRNEVVGRNLEVAVVLQHAGVDDLGHTDALELVEVVAGLEGLGDLDRAVAAEVEEDDGVAVADGADRAAVIGDDEGRQVLVDDALVLLTQRRDRLAGRGEAPPGAEDVGLPAELDHAPVRLVAVHRDAHAAAAGGEARLEVGAAEAGHKGLHVVDVVQGAGRRHVAAVEQGVDAHAPDALGAGLADQGLELVDVGVDVAVGEQADEVHDAAGRAHVLDEALPDRGGKDLAALDRLVDELGALGIDLAGAEGVVPDLGVAHVVVRGEADGRAMGLDRGPGVVLKELVEGRRARGAHRIAGLIAADADAVQDDE